MAHLTLRVQALAALALCGAVAVACGNKDESSSTGGDGDGDGDGDTLGSGGIVGSGGGTGTGGTTAGTGGSSSTSACDGLSVVGGTDPLIDDLDHDGESTIPDTDNRVGSWFTSNDMTPGAEQTPASDMAFPTAGVGYTADSDAEDFGFATTATGFSDPAAPNGPWGANFGLSLNDQSGNGCAYDASAFDGIGFCAMSGDGEDYTLNVAVPIPAIIPTSRGGTCSGEGCDDSHFKTVTIGADWECYEIEWSELNQNAGWIHENKYDFDPSNIAQITWNSQAGTYNVIVDEVRFLGEGTGAGGAGGASN